MKKIGLRDNVPYGLGQSPKENFQNISNYRFHSFRYGTITANYELQYGTIFVIILLQRRTK